MDDFPLHFSFPKSLPSTCLTTCDSLINFFLSDSTAGFQVYKLTGVCKEILQLFFLHFSGMGHIFKILAPHEHIFDKSLVGVLGIFELVS